ncbi:MAG: carbohydrate ABC transporter permease [Euzebyaceae bacterium]|jgi:multiple sugar transport system permease protein|nr:carbohydrate ABC transporter permease [Euzebyaceae bacterium]
MATVYNPSSSETSRRLRSAGYYLVIAVVFAPFLFVFYYMISTSLKSPLDITAPDFRWLFVPTLDNYREVFVENEFLQFTVNSMIVALGSTLIGLAIGLPAAYVIAKYRAPKLALLILSARVTPGITFLIPWFILFSRIRMIDTYTALILTHLLQNLPLMVFLMISFFEEVPDEIIESAKVDGATTWRSFRSVVMPLAKGGIAASAILGFIFSWNHFMFSIVLSGNDTRTLPVAVFNFMSFGSVNWGAITAAATIMSVPVILLTLTVQRHIVKGLAIGAVKG